MLEQLRFSVQTPGRSLISLTEPLEERVRQSGIQKGLAHLFLHHTSASLIFCEKADPQVLRDLEAYMQRLVKDGDPLFKHIDEGPDDMSAHVRSVLTANFLSMPISEGRLDLGTWQGVYLWEHREKGYERKLTLTLLA